MKALIVYSNPNMEGHCGTILKSVQEELRQRNIPHAVLNLEKAEFNPVMSIEEYKGAASEQTKRYQELLAANDKLIFIYPVWWNSMPAIMKGFFDKVLAPRFAYRYIKYPIIPFAIPKGLLTGKKAAVFMTSGSKNWQSLLVMGDRFKKLIRKDILGFCAIKSKVFRLDGCITPVETRKKEIEKLAKKGIKYLFD
ncbi:MAG TPA: NAD(P)H-dependent oxidoreductase [Acidobacteriota bacterium]|nr:NAD(P)H-dependent oxidoreductase [Acidobacteriota bacterium]